MQRDTPRRAVFSFAASHDTCRTLNGFPADCERGRAWSSTSVPVAEMPGRIAELRGR
jgi:hypothetical protein